MNTYNTLEKKPRRKESLNHAIKRLARRAIFLDNRIKNSIARHNTSFDISERNSLIMAVEALKICNELHLSGQFESLSPDLQSRIKTLAFVQRKAKKDDCKSES